MLLEFTDILLILIIFQFLIFNIYILHKGRKQLSNIFLIFFFSAEIIGLFPILILSHSEFFYNYNPHLFFIGIPAWYLLAPIMYLYVKSMVYIDFKLKKKHLLHLIPFLFLLLYFVFSYHIYDYDQKQILHKNKSIGNKQIGLLINLSFNAQVVIYNIISLIILYSYRKRLKEQLSSLKKRSLSWLRYFLFSFIIACCSVYVLIPALLLIIDFNAMLVDLLIYFVIFTLLFYKAIINPDIFIKIKKNPDHKKKSLSSVSRKQYLEKLLLYMETEKPYLDPEITLNDLSDKVSIPPRSLSEVINDSLDQNFYSFINSFRIKESQKLFEETANKQKTVLEILYEVGFNSKSSFNTAFKEKTGMTPSQYKMKSKVKSTSVDFN